ncbi:MAG: heme biosynthesis protein HemY [Hyphomicrobium sp.]
MSRLVLYFVAVLVITVGLSWLADRPGNIVVDWEGYRGELSVFNAVVALTFLTAAAVVVWSVLRQLWTSPATVGRLLMRRKQQRGLDALSSGMIAVGAGDRGNATRYALAARKSLPNEPLTHLLRAQAAQLSGDKATARRIFEAMLSSPDTEQLGLRGLYLEAARLQEAEPARQFAERALRLNPKLAWPVEALFDLQCKASDWTGALETLTLARKHAHLDKPTADRRRAVLLSAQAQNLEDADSGKALTIAMEAHALAPSLVPAAAIAGRLLASRGNTPRAAKVLQKTWAKSPHPELAAAYAYARIGDSPRDRLDRVKQLAALTPHSIEGPIAVASAAIESKRFDEARSALAPMLESRLTQRIATLMARIEGEEHGDRGRVREWLARAVNAPRDPAWTADGIVSERWAAISPVTGTLDAFQWRVPVDDMQAAEGEELTTRLESLVALGATSVDIDITPEETADQPHIVAATAVPEAVPPSVSAKPSRTARRAAVVDAETVSRTAPSITATEPADERRAPAPIPVPVAEHPLHLAEIGGPGSATAQKGDVAATVSRPVSDVGEALGEETGEVSNQSSAQGSGKSAENDDARIVPASPSRTIRSASRRDGTSASSRAAASRSDGKPVDSSEGRPGQTPENGPSPSSEARGETRADTRPEPKRRRKSDGQRAAEPPIYMPTRPPDDPGPEIDELAETAVVRTVRPS